MDYTADMESPDSFFRWAAIATVAGVLRDNVYLPQKKSPLYPNLYILLLADSAIDRKSTPLSIAGELVAEIRNTKIIRGRTSVQAILKVLGEATMDRVTGITTIGGSCFYAPMNLPHSLCKILQRYHYLQICTITDVNTMSILKEKVEPQLKTCA